MTGQEMINLLRDGDKLTWKGNYKSRVPEVYFDPELLEVPSGRRPAQHQVWLDGYFTAEHLRAIADFMDDSSVPLCRVAASP